MPYTIRGEGQDYTQPKTIENHTKEEPSQVTRAIETSLFHITYRLHKILRKDVNFIWSIIRMDHVINDMVLGIDIFCQKGSHQVLGLL